MGRTVFRQARQVAVQYFTKAANPDNYIYLKGTFTVEDAALYLGITTSHLYKLVRKYDIPHSRPTNGRIFFNKEELDKWIRSRMVIEPETGMPNGSEQPHECYY